MSATSRHRGAPAIERYGYGGRGLRTEKRRAGCASPALRHLPGLEMRCASRGERLQAVTLPSGSSQLRILRWTAGRPDTASNGMLRFGLADALGSGVLEIDADARKLTQEIYYPFGGTACAMARHHCEIRYKTARYAGKERDDTGLYYYGFRYYAPWMGRWTSTDPAGAVDGPNLFAMVRNNPVRYRDALGLAGDEPAGQPPRITAGQTTRAAAAAFFRDGVSTLGSTAIRYGAGIAMTALLPVTPAANIALTIAGATAGAIAGAYGGGGMGSRAADWLPAGYANNRGARFVLSGVGALGGAITGMGPSVAGYFMNPGGLNAGAMNQLRMLIYVGARDTAQQAVAEVGPRVNWAGQPPLSGVAASAIPYAVVLAGVGAFEPYLPDWASIFTNTLIEGIDGASGTVIRALRSDAEYIEGRGGLSIPNARGTLHSALTRMDCATMILGLDLATATIGATPGSPGAGALGRITTAPAVFRFYLGAVGVQPGYAELFHSGDWSGFSADPRCLSAPATWGDRPPSANDEPGLELRFVLDLESLAEFGSRTTLN